jgi:hypothetical protein
MIAKKSLQSNPITMNLYGEEGNAYSLLMHAIHWCKQTGRNWEAITNEMTSKDYKHLVSVIEKEFKGSVIFVR